MTAHNYIDMAIPQGKLHPLKGHYYQNTAQRGYLLHAYTSGS